MSNRSNYYRLKNGKLEVGGLPLNYIFVEEKKKYGLSVKVH
tara:strand:+ start:216 stop:338 length:123 start_codon:yes stop_codon:yes gene_type:complete